MTVRVRTLKIQSQTGGLTERFVVLSEREQGVHDEGTEEREQNLDKVKTKTISTQTEVTYTFWNKCPRFQKKRTA